MKIKYFTKAQLIEALCSVGEFDHSTNLTAGRVDSLDENVKCPIFRHFMHDTGSIVNIRCSLALSTTEEATIDVPIQMFNKLSTKEV